MAIMKFQSQVGSSVRNHGNNRSEEAIAVNTIGRACQLGSKVTRESLEREFRLAFSEVDFSRTELFPAICDWEAANKDAYKILGDNTRAVQIAVSIANRSMITPPHPSK